MTIACNHPTDERYFTDDNLLEWCGLCGQVVTDHHERKFGEEHPTISTRGGKRPRAGRKPITTTEEIIKIETWMPTSLAVKAKALGDGNVSAGVRQAIETAKEI